jgi:hypothetical protein
MMVCCAAAPGTTMRGTYARQIATGTPARTVTTTSVFGWPLGCHREQGSISYAPGVVGSVNVSASG